MLAKQIFPDAKKGASPVSKEQGRIIDQGICGALGTGSLRIVVGVKITRAGGSGEIVPRTHGSPTPNLAAKVHTFCQTGMHG